MEEISKKEEESRKKLADLEKQLDEQVLYTYDPACVRKKSNWSKTSNIFKFDDPAFDPKTMLESLPSYSPKLEALLKKIDQLDKEDMKKHGKLFKHFVFSDLKFGNYGAKMLASAFIAKGYHLGYSAAKKGKAEKPKEKEEKKEEEIKVGGADNDDDEDKKSGKKRYQKIEILSDNVLKQNKNENFFMLSSTTVYDQSITVAMKKTVLAKFNQRPENVHGELVRFIILDSGFKEGIDLFDIKYIHIFEPSTVPADEKQVIGRGTRTCGQKGLEFHPTQGWPLHVFVYDLEIQQQLQKGFMGVESAMDLYLKAMNINFRLLNFSHDLERTVVVGSVDYELNKNVHDFSIPFVSVDEDKENHQEHIHEHVPDDVDLLYGGDEMGEEREPKNKKKLTILPGTPVVMDDAIIHPIEKNDTPKRLGFEEMRHFIRNSYGEFAWDEVKMENMCAEKKKGGAGGEILKYTPTQEFIRHYFHPLNPVKGMLLYQSVGTGKTCSAIAAATNNFEKQGYTILWVTRTTLKNDIWKNMFDQVCNESIRHQIENSGLKIPDEQDKRMRLLSKAWRIRPMSYKQFSNLVSKQNALYEMLVKINGKEDPLRKTLLIIDEAHKLYGGDDLSSLEKPDMNALHKALMYSYQFSGKDSVRVMLMTATPITQDPMELVQLVNLLKPANEQMPADFSNFSEKYLNDEGKFTDAGRTQFLDDISGYISYLNRSKDARQFSQPQIHHVKAPIISDITVAQRFDKKMVKDLLDTNVVELKQQVDEENKKLEESVHGITAKKFGFLKDNICGDITGKEKTQCVKIVNNNIREMMAEVKNHTREIREKIQNIKEQIKQRSGMKKSALAEVRKNIENYGDEYEEYKNSLLYELKDKCSVKMTNKGNFDEHPELQQYIHIIKNYNEEIEDLRNQLKNQMDNYKSRMHYLNGLLKTDLNNTERNIIKMTIKEERSLHNKTMKIRKSEVDTAVKTINADIAETEKRKKAKYSSIRKTLKRSASEQRKHIKSIEAEKKRLRKTLKSQDTELKHDFVNELVKRYESKIMDQMVDVSDQVLLQKKDKERAKMEKIQQRNTLKQIKQQERQREQTRKKEERQREQTRKKEERERLRATKKNK